MCKDIKNISQLQIIRKDFLDEALALTYCIDARTSNLADVTQADAFT
jgi:hypothetical protein